MSLSDSEDTVVLGYVGDQESVPAAVEAIFADSGRYQVATVSIEALGDGDDHVDGLVLGTDGVDEGEAALISVLDTDYPLIAVGPDRSVTLPGRILPHVDEFVSLDGNPVDALGSIDALFDQRWRNLGMSAEKLLEVIFETVPVHLYLKDQHARHVRASEYYEHDVELVGKSDREVIEDTEFAQLTYADDENVLATGDPLIDESEFNPDSGEWSLTSKVPVYDGEDIVGLIGATRLITQRKEYEQQLERQKERLEEFASIISHDLRNPLTVAHGRIDLGRESYPDDENLQVASKHLQRMDRLIDDVLTMTRQGQDVDETEPVELETIVWQSWEGVATADATLAVEDSCRFDADHGRVRQVFENLFRNAVEHGSTSPQSHTPEDAVEHGSTSPQSHTPEDAAEHCGGDVCITVGVLTDESGTADEGSRDGHCEGFYVSDDGPGIPAEERKDVFEHGFTTSEDGTGLGLKIVRQVVEAHGWSITTTESADGGARFEIWGVEPAG